MAATRRLAAIMFTDIVGYTALAQKDEANALKLLDRHNRLLRPIFPRFHGREVKAIGDSFLVEFQSALDATNCAIEIQRFLSEESVSAPDESKVRVRIGIHLGDVVHKSGDVFGDSVNIASRIEPLAEPGGICISEPVFGQVRNKIPNQLEKLEPKALKNVRFPMDVYRVVLPWTVSEAPPATLEPTRLAVLPFVNISRDPNDEYFADGLTEEMIARLSLLKGLEVIARTSVMNYKNKEKSASQIGKELGAGTLLEGSVRKAGSRIRVTVQLIDSTTEGHLLVENYDRNLEDIFAVQSEIAERVSSALQVRLLEEDRKRIEKGGTRKVEAYTFLLKGRFHLNRWVESSLKEAISYFEKAVAQDAGYAAAYAGLARAYAALGGLESVDIKEAYPKAQAYARKALELDAALPEAHAALAVAIWNTNDFATVVRELKKALELNPNSIEAHELLAAAFGAMGRRDEGIREAERALELDPLSVQTAGAAGTTYLYAKQYEKAIEHLKNAVELDPSNSFYLTNLGLAHIQLGKIEEGLAEVKRAAEASEPLSHPRDLAYAYVKAGKIEEARGILAKLLESDEGGRSRATAIGGVYACLGEKEKALDWLERAYEEHSGYIWAIASDFVFESLNDHPRFQALLKKMKFA